MSFSFREAKRENVFVLVGLAGGTGSGKTYSAMRLATGLAGGKRFAVIDTENGRALHYADQFAFDHGTLSAPFRPDAYADAIEAAARAGYGVILVDSCSHEHAGEGGLLDWHEEELERMAGDDWKKREAVKMAAWIKPKTSHKKFVSRLLQVNAHLIICFRAEEKIEIVKVDGKTVVQPKRSLTGLDGWIPVCEKNLPYELTLSFLVTAESPGVPRPIKLQAQHRPFFPADKEITEEAGAMLAAWAAGAPRSELGVSHPAATDPERDRWTSAGHSAGTPPGSDDHAAPGLITIAQKARLNQVCAKLLDAGHITTEQLVAAVGGEPVPDEKGELHFAPFRDRLSQSEASALIERLVRYAEKVVVA